MSNKEIWISPYNDKKYKQVKGSEGKFQLIMIGGSLSSSIGYQSKQEAIDDGWKVEENKDEN